MNRANYYRERQQRERRRIDEGLVITLVKKVRKVHPKMGTRKIQVLIETELRENNVNMGRDRLFEMLRKNKMLIKRSRRGVHTTESRHVFRTYRNLIKDTPVTAPHQCWVSDITYVRTEEGFMYLALIMDAYSRKVVGHHISDSLETEGCVRALARAMRQLPQGKHPIHHSDRGIQYCCHEYVKRLRKSQIRISMTEANHCYENAQAERLNGILKQEYGLNYSFRNKRAAAMAAAQAIKLYNAYRPHTMLSYKTPDYIHEVAA